MSALLIATAIGAALVAGLFYGFSTFVMGALARLSPAEGIRAMQSINVVVINPWAMGLLFGTGLLAVLLVIIGFVEGNGPPLVPLLAGSLYILGCLAVTGTRNVPLNDRLASVDAEDAEAADLWQDYLGRWTWWNHVRTVASLAAAIILLA